MEKIDETSKFLLQTLFQYRDMLQQARTTLDFYAENGGIYLKRHYADEAKNMLEDIEVFLKE